MRDTMVNHAPHNDGSEEFPRQHQCLAVMLSLADFMNDVRKKVPEVLQQQLRDADGQPMTVEQVCQDVTQLCTSMSIGGITGPQPKIAKDILSLARHFNRLDAGIDTAPLYRIVDKAHQAGITDKDIKSAQRHIDEWMSGRQSRGRS